MSEPTPGQIVAAFRAAGLTVHEMPGWGGRCRCHVGPHGVGLKVRSWEGPKAITWHHTAGPMLSGQAAIDYTRRILVGGNGVTTGPLCLAGIDADGRLLMVGAGRANHIGSISAKADVANRTGSWPTNGYTDWRGSGIDGNKSTWGFEILAPMTPNGKQIAAAVTATAVLCRLAGIKPGSVHGHGEASNQRSFEDPNLDMGAIRRRVAAALTTPTITKPTIKPTAAVGDKDWSDMATKAEIESVVRKVVREELNRPFAGPWLATFGKGADGKPRQAMQAIRDAIAQAVKR